MAGVQLSGVIKRYHSSEVAVDNIDLEIRDGEFLVLVGPSGCGKTTTLRMIAGLESPTAGEIAIGGRRVNEVLPRDRNIAMVFQDYALYANMTVRDNLAFGLRMRKEPKRQVDERVSEVARLLHIDHLLSRRPRQLSGGQRQRVALGRAIIRRPELFLMDEPLSNLDALLRVHTRTEILKLHELLGTTVVYVTHDQIEAMTMGTRIVVMRDGRIQQVGTPEEIYDEPVNRFVAGFFGSPPMNFIAGRVEQDARGVLFRSGPLTIPLSAEHGTRWRNGGAAPGQEVVLGIRPESVQLGGDGADGGVSLPAEVEVVEPIGYETIVYVNPGVGSLAVRAQSRVRINRHETVPVTVFPGQVHVFDAADGTVLTAGVAAGTVGAPQRSQATPGMAVGSH